VSVPGANSHDTRSTATWPPKRMVSSLVSSIEARPGWAERRARAVRIRRVRTPPPVSVLALVLDRHVHLFRLDLADQLGHAPRERRVVLDARVVHRLHR